MALLLVVGVTAPAGSDARRTVTLAGPPAVLPDFGLLPSLAYDANRRQVVIFNNRGETWLWAKNQWTQAHPAVSPSGRIGAVAAWDPMMGAVLLAGGQSYADETVLHDTWSWNGSIWRKVGTRATAAPGNYMLAMSYDADLEQMVLVASDIRYGMPIQLWTWDGTTWHERKGAAGPVSPVAVVAFDPITETVLAVSAKCSHSDCLSETWSWNGGSWQQLKPAHEPGFSFSSMVLVEDPISRRLLLLTVAPRPIGPAPTETWGWDGQDWRPLGRIGEQGAMVVATTGDGVQRKILAFEDLTRDFETVRIDAWEWTGDSWKPISTRSASG